MIDWEVFEPTDEDLKEFGSLALDAAMCAASNFATLNSNNSEF